MDEVETWLRTLTEDILIVEQAADDVMRARFQPCARTVELAIEAEQRGPLEIYSRTLAEFDERLNTVTLYPLNTRPGSRFLSPKYPTLQWITVELECPINVATQAGAEAIFDDLPDGFIKDWRWGLGIHKLFEPILQAVRKVEFFPETQPREPGRPRPVRKGSLRLSRTMATQIAPPEYVLNLSTYNRLKLGLQRIQNDHRERALSERQVLAHNTLLTAVAPERYPALTPHYKPDTVYKILQAGGETPKLSRQDHRALLGAIGDQASTLSRETPEQVSAMLNSVQVATLDHLVERFRALLERKNSLEADWQTLLSQNRFLLSLVFGYPVVVVQEQAGVGVSGLDGAGARFADFLLKNPVTNSAALVELKRPSTNLVAKGEYGGVRQIHGDLIQAVMQVLGQRHRLLTNMLVHKAAGHGFEGWNVGCVVVVGGELDDRSAHMAFDLYRQSLKDVVVLTYGELLARLIDLRGFLAGPEDAPPGGGQTL